MADPHKTHKRTDAGESGIRLSGGQPESFRRPAPEPLFIPTVYAPIFKPGESAALVMWKI